MSARVSSPARTSTDGPVIQLLIADSAVSDTEPVGASTSSNAAVAGSAEVQTRVESAPSPEVALADSPYTCHWTPRTGSPRAVTTRPLIVPVRRRVTSPRFFAHPGSISPQRQLAFE